MSDAQRPVLVFGATGRQGGSVVKALLQARWAVRALVREPEGPKAAALRDAGVALVPGSFTDPDSIRAAMKDAYGVFVVLPGDLADGEEVRAGTAIVDLAREAGIAHFVYSSGASVGNTLTGVARFDAKPLIEAHIRDTPVTATIIRPMIFMEMLVRPGLGLDEGRFTFFVRPEQSMQLTAVADIGRFVAAIFADRARFAGETLKVASDTVTGGDLQAAFSEAAQRPIDYARFPEKLLAGNPDLNHMARSLDDGPLGEHVDLTVMRDLNPGLLSFRSWLAQAGRKPLQDALATGGAHSEG